MRIIIKDSFLFMKDVTQMTTLDYITFTGDIITVDEAEKLKENSVASAFDISAESISDEFLNEYNREEYGTN